MFSDINNSRKKLSIEKLLDNVLSLQDFLTTRYYRQQAYQEIGVYRMLLRGAVSFYSIAALSLGLFFKYGGTERMNQGAVPVASSCAACGLVSFLVLKKLEWMAVARERNRGVSIASWLSPGDYKIFEHQFDCICRDFSKYDQYFDTENIDKDKLSYDFILNRLIPEFKKKIESEKKHSTCCLKC